MEPPNRLLIRILLLDRFLACMKPASITQRQLRAGVFFGERQVAIRSPAMSHIVIPTPTSKIRQAVVEAIIGASALAP